MTTRSAALVVFLLCASALLMILVFGHAGPSDGSRNAGAASPAPAAIPAAPPGGAGAVAAAIRNSASIPTPAPSLVPPPPGGASAPGDGMPIAAVPKPPVNTLEDPPLTDEEKARGIAAIPGGGRVDLKNRTLSLPSEVCLRSGPLELFACAEGGKDHESVLRVRCRPELVNLNLILFGLKKGPCRARPGVPEGDRVLVFCEWTAEGKKVSVRAEDLVWNCVTDRPMDRVGWTYIGSRFVPERDVETGQATGRSVFEAVYGRTILATFDDAASLIGTPLPEGVDDSTFRVNEKATPPAGTAVRLVIRPPTAEELAEIRKLEAQIGEERKARPPHGRRREEAGPGDKPPAPPPGGAENAPDEKK